MSLDRRLLYLVIATRNGRTRLRAVVVRTASSLDGEVAEFFAPPEPRSRRRMRY